MNYLITGQKLINLARFGFGGKSSLENNCNIYGIGKCIYVKGKI